MLLLLGVYSVTGMYGSVPRESALQLLRRAPCMGIAGFDTAGVYGRGLGETLLAEAFPRGHPLVMTKVGYDWSGPRPVLRVEPEFLLREARRAVERLGFRPVYLIQLHNPPLSALRRRETYRVLRLWVEEGLALHAGIALGPEVDVLAEGLEALSHDEVEYIQIVYNMLEQEPGRILAQIARRSGVKVIVRVPHAGGVLDESVTAPPRELGDHRRLRRKGWYIWALNLYARIRPLLSTHPGTPGQKALAWIRDTINPDYTVLTARDPGRLAEYTSYTIVPPIPRKILEDVRRLYEETLPSSPEKPSCPP